MSDVESPCGNRTSWARAGPPGSFPKFTRNNSFNFSRPLSVSASSAPGTPPEESLPVSATGQIHWVETRRRQGRRRTKREDRKAIPRPRQVGHQRRRTGGQSHIVNFWSYAMAIASLRRMFAQRPRARSGRQQQRAPRRNTRLTLDPLDARLVPAVFTVTTTADVLGGSHLSLRQAILNANQTPGPNVINLTVPGTYRLTRF